MAPMSYERNLFMKNLKKLREAQGLSQSKLAEKLSITQQSIYKYENDLAFPNLETLKMMSNLFHVSIDFLVENEILSSNQPPLPTPLTKKEEELLTYFQQLPPVTQKAIVDLLKSIT